MKFLAHNFDLMLAPGPRGRDLRGTYEIKLHIKSLEAKLAKQQAKRIIEADFAAIERRAVAAMRANTLEFTHDGLYFGPPMPVTIGE